MKKWVKFAIAGAVVVSVVAYLMVTGLTSYSVYYLKVADLVKNPQMYDAKGARLSGNVVEGSVAKDTLNAKLLTFDIADTDGSKLSVEYTGVVPDAFEEGVEVIVEGRYDPNATKFYAKTLLAKCPSKYEGADPAEHEAATASLNQ